MGAQDAAICLRASSRRGSAGTARRPRVDPSGREGFRVNKQKLLMAAVAGITMGVTSPPMQAESKADEVKCYGINGCGGDAKCAVTKADLDAVRKLLGDKDYKSRFGKSEVHSCGGHAKCGASDQILNWLPTTAGECKEKGGIVIDEVDGKKVAKKA
jgi:hypothetical protein